jgi:hypothetical protein
MTRSNMWRTAIALLLAVFVTHAHARPDAKPRHFGERGGFFAQLDLDVGGDDIVREIVTDTLSGPHVETERTSMGDGPQLILGAFYRPWQSLPIELYFGVGGKFSAVLPSEEGDMWRYVGEFKAQYRFTDRWFLGGGIVHHRDMEISRGGSADPDDHPFKPATGFFLEGGWNYLAVHVTQMKYKPKLGGPSLDANTIGIRIINRF